MVDVPHKDASIRRVVAEVYQRVPGRLVAVEDCAPEDPYVITFVRASDGAELCTVRTEGNEPGRYDIITDEVRVPRCLIQGVVWRVKHGLGRKRA
jgi:hypothetical protein